MTYRKTHTIFLLSVTLALFTMVCGCTTVSQASAQPKSTRDMPQYWLTTSMYAGPFYDDDKITLIDSKTFSAIDDVETVDGITVRPTKIERIIPAGTLVKIKDISYPDDQTRLKRPLYSPRDRVWIYLAVARERGMVSIFRVEDHIMVMPASVSNHDQVKGYLSRFLSNQDPNRWILQEPSHIQDGIFKKKPIIGMKQEHILAALGPAIKKQFKNKSGFDDDQEIWHYHDYLIVFSEHRVTKISKLGKTASLKK